MCGYMHIRVYIYIYQQTDGSVRFDPVPTFDGLVRTVRFRPLGLEDNLYLERGVLATNDQLIAKAASIIDSMGVGLMTPEEVRAELQLEKRMPA